MLPFTIQRVERWFGHLDNKAIRRGIFRSVADLRKLTRLSHAPG
jgi:hypothetical protein